MERAKGAQQRLGPNYGNASAEKPPCRIACGRRRALGRPGANTSHSTHTMACLMMNMLNATTRRARICRDPGEPQCDGQSPAKKALIPRCGVAFVKEASTGP